MGHGSRRGVRRQPADTVTPACASDIWALLKGDTPHAMTGRDPVSTPVSDACTAPREVCVSREHNVACTKGGKCKGRVRVKETGESPSKWHVTPRTARVKANRTPKARLIAAQTTM